MQFSLDKLAVTVYSYSMVKQEKLIKKAQNNPNGLNFGDFETLMSRSGWVLDHQTGSHQIWYSPAGYRISVQSRSGYAKGYQVKQFLNRYNWEANNG